MKNKTFFSLLISLFIFAACEPYVEDGIDLPALPEDPSFTVTQDTDNPNKFIVTATSEGFFGYAWDLPGGTPSNSSLATDTIIYTKAGDYDITLYASKVGGGGSSSATKSITVDDDLLLACDDNLTLLTAECTSKCWKLSEAPGSIAVGPTPLSTEWFTSSGLDGAQVDDLWCFHFSGATFEYLNNNNTFSACTNYSVVEDYPIPANMTYSIEPSGSDFSELKIVLPDEFWMGVEDSGNFYEIVSLTETEMILLAPIAPCDGSASNGWFTLTFIAQ